MEIPEIDSIYTPFPDFDKWNGIKVDLDSWAEFCEKQKALKSTHPEKLEKALKIITEAAAIETGAIESLYELERGFTVTVAAKMATWEAAINKKNEKEKSLIKSQLDAYSIVLDFATESRPISETWIRELHHEICKAQEKYAVHLPDGTQKLKKLPLGEYKKDPNHVVLLDGTCHAYAPVEQTIQEMERLINNVKKKEFQGAHAIIQAAFVHYALVCIHPFADGNGRVARALASVFTYRHASVPLLITLDRKNEYIDALADADSGRIEKFIEFISERMLDVEQILELSISAAEAPDPRQLVANIAGFYQTSGGYTYEMIDGAGFSLLGEVQRVCKEMPQEFPLEELKMRWASASGVPSAEEFHRLPHRGKGSNIFNAELTLPAPASCGLRIVFNVQVPLEGGKKDTVIIAASISNSEGLGQYIFEAELRDLIPNISTSVQMRLLFYIKMVFSHGVNRLMELGQIQLKSQGYIR
jgi:Fic family protein